VKKKASAYDRIYAVVRRIPRGRVTNYGDVAQRAGLPGRARQVGYALHACKEEDGLPWHRVVNAQGEVSLRSDLGMDQIQRQLLEAEGVEFNDRGRVDLAHFGWKARGSNKSKG